MTERETDFMATNVQPEAESAPHKDPSFPLRIEGTKEEIAEEIAQISPEGTPGDARVGPGLLAIELLVAVLGLGAISLAGGLWLGWPVGVGMFAIAMLALLFNPSALAAALRIGERRQVAERHRKHDKITIVRRADFEPRHR